MPPGGKNELHIYTLKFNIQQTLHKITLYNEDIQLQPFSIDKCREVFYQVER